jgi:hypothetical protein
MLSPELLRLDANGATAAEGNLPLREAFFNPAEIIDNGIDSILRGMAAQQAQEIDAHIVDDVRNFLFGPPGAGGFDLASLNMQRGRDHGLPDYNTVRMALGLAPATSFADITSDPALQGALSDAYKGDVNNIDVWVGGLAENHVAGASVGELIRTVLVDQFTRLREADRFWYQRIFRGRKLRTIENTTLADVIERNTHVAGLQANVFFAGLQQPIQADPPAPKILSLPIGRRTTNGAANKLDAPRNQQAVTTTSAAPQAKAAKAVEANHAVESKVGRQSRRGVVAKRFGLRDEIAAIDAAFAEVGAAP